MTRLIDNRETKLARCLRLRACGALAEYKAVRSTMSATERLDLFAALMSN
jgi:hypothetical protein